MRFLTLATCLFNASQVCGAQSADTAVTDPPLPPATKLEAFAPKAGEVRTLGYTVLGNIASGMLVKGTLTFEVRRLQDSRGSSVRGVVVEVGDGGPLGRTARSFVDEEELPELLNGLEALLSVRANPTPFRNFEVRYKTRGELDIAVVGSESTEVQYLVTAGRVFKESRWINEREMTQFREWVAAAQKILYETPP